MQNLTRRGFIGVGAAATMAAALAGCSSNSSSSSKSSASSSSAAASSAAAAAGSLRFVTGGESGTYYAVGGVIATHASDKAGLKITPLSSEGSKDNVEKLDDGKAELGFCQSDVMAYAYEGTNIFKGMPITTFSTVAALYEEQVQIVTCDSSIKTVADLKGKRVSIGAANSGVYFNAIDILGAYDITEKDITASYQSFGDSANDLKDGKIDAAFIVAGAPTTAITELSTSKKAYLVALDSEHVDKLIKASPYYVKTTIKAGTYDGQTEDVTTVAVSAVILASDKTSEDDIYKLTKDIFDNLTELTSSHKKFAEVSLDKAAAITSVPYHKGAAKYFTEKGKTVKTK